MAGANADILGGNELGMTRYLTVSQELFARFLREGLPGCRVVAAPLPDDVRIVSVHLDDLGDIVLGLYSAAFTANMPAQIGSPLYEDIVVA